MVLMKCVGLFEIERIQGELIFNVGRNAIVELRMHGCILFLRPRA